MKNRKARQRELFLLVLRGMADDDVQTDSARRMIKAFADNIKRGIALTENQVSLLIASGRSMGVDVSEYLDLVWTRPDDAAKIKKKNQFIAGLEELASEPYIIPESEIPF